MSLPPQTPLPLPTFHESGEACPKDLLDFLQTLVARLQDETHSQLMQQDSVKWIAMMNAINADFLAPFPGPSEFPWNTMHEKSKVSEVVFDVLYHIALRVGEVLLPKEELVQGMFVRLVNIALSLDPWLDVSDVEVKEGFPTPKDLRTRALLAAREMLFSLANRVKLDPGGSPGWGMMTKIADECIAVCQDVLNASYEEEFYVRFFSTPRITMSLAEEAKSQPHIYVSDSSQIPLLLTGILKLLYDAITPPPLTQCFMYPIVTRMAETTRQCYDFLISPTCQTTESKRARSITRLIHSASSGLQLYPPFRSIADTMRLHVLISRLHDGPLDIWADSDKILVEAFEQPFASPPLRTDVHSVLSSLKEEQWEEKGEYLRRLATAYMRQSLPTLDEEMLQEIRTFAESRAPDRVYASLTKVVVNAVSARQSREPSQAVTVSRRTRITELVEKIISPDTLSWMDDDSSLSDSQFALRAFVEVERRFDQPIYNPSAKARALLAEDLGRLMCACAHPAEVKCPGASNKLPVKSLSACMRVLETILDGPENEVTPTARRLVYDALSKCMRHQKSGYHARVDHAEQFAVRGMKDQDRSVRLRAGRCVSEFVKLNIGLEDGVHRIEQLFNSIKNILIGTDEYLKETTLITVGYIAKFGDSETFLHCIFSLLFAIGQSNPVVSGTAYLQLTELCKHYNKTGYTLFSPYMDRIAPYLVTKMATNSAALTETCSFIGISLRDFLSITVRHTLPALYANRDRRGVEMISEIIEEPVARLFVRHAPTVLARVFMIPKPGQSTIAYNFVVTVLSEHIHKSSQDAAVVENPVVAYGVDTVSHLIMMLGDEDSGSAVKQALLKVNKHLQAKKQTTYDSADEAVVAMLKENMVGIVTKLNDFLQGHEGRMSVDVKRKILRALGGFIKEVGPSISNVAPQLMATLQTSVVIPELIEDSLRCWELFIRTLGPRDLGPHVGPTSAAFVTAWPSFSAQSKQTARRCLDYIISKKNELKDYLDEIVDLEPISELEATWRQLQSLRKDWTSEYRLQKLLDRAASDNAAVIIQALQELKAFLLQEDEQFVRRLTSGDFFDPRVGHIVTVLFTAAARDPEESSNENIHTLAFDCIGIMGAVDPDRFEYGGHDGGMIVTSNFEDEDESIAFVLHLIKDVLVGAFRSTCDIAYQNVLAYAIQNLMINCKFTPAILTTGSAVPKKVRTRWNALPKHIVEVLTPLMAGNFSIEGGVQEKVVHPIYPSKSTYREWLQAWTAYLIEQVSAPNAKKIFSKFHAIVRDKDVGVARHILPHLVLNILLSGDETQSERVRHEIRAVLEDQVAVDSASSPDKKELSAQVIFSLMDHLNKWVRLMRQSIAQQKASTKRKRHGDSSPEAEQLLLIDSILTSIDQGLMANAALHCKAYARALMCFEQQLVVQGDVNRGSASRQAAFERLHEIYAQLDEPDGMEGVSTLILAPSLEHQIREHENTGRWTSAQSCWEVKLQNSPDDLESHLGLLRCLRNLGHYDTLRTHVEGLLTRRPAWESEVLGYQIESEWMVGNWPVVESLAMRSNLESSPVLLAKVLLAMRSRDHETVAAALSTARKLLGTPIIAAGPRGYRRSYEAVLDLHILHEIDVIYNTAIRGDASQLANRLDELEERLTTRLDSTLPNFRFREPILSVRRTAFSLLRDTRSHFSANIGKSWLLSAKLARKAGYWQTAYSAILQGRQAAAPFYFIEDAKLLNASGEPLRALQELEKSLDLIPSVKKAMGENVGDVMDLTSDDDDSSNRTIAKAVKLRARWMNESDRYDSGVIFKVFCSATNLWSEWESGRFHIGQFQDECFKNLDPNGRYSKQQASKLNIETIKHFSMAIQCGSKYIYQTVPRLLTLWLDMGEDPEANPKDLEIANLEVSKLIRAAPIYKWYTAFPQIVSRVGHRNDRVYKILEKLICLVIREYPHQALWLFISVFKSKYDTRSERGQKIFQLLRGTSNRKNISDLITASISMSNELLNLCNLPVDDRTMTLSMSDKFPKLFDLAPCSLIIPLRESLTASLPPTSSSTSKHQPFPVDLPTFHKFHDEIEVMRSLAKPRKITMYGSDGRIYMFLGKPKDDLRKDARLMDFNTIINKLLQSNSESRRRKLYIRTYGVVTLNEECGFIQWVPNTIPVRPVLQNLYQAKGLSIWGPHTKGLYDKVIACRTLPEAGKTFRKEILSYYPPVFHEWFIETFPEPSAWHASRLAFTRTAAVMSMVGFILGLGDRHCENILLDKESGDAIHVDFNCLFEKGKNLETPERVPFRLTQNIVDGFGVTGVEGVFRTACEITMQLLRQNRDCLMTVLDAFVHDPLVEWEEEHRKKSARARREQNQVKVDVDLRKLARNALQPIGRKLRGIHTVGLEKAQKELTTSSLVQTLILESTDDGNLGKMYPGWAPHC